MILPKFTSTSSFKKTNTIPISLNHIEKMNFDSLSIKDCEKLLYNLQNQLKESKRSSFVSQFSRISVDTKKEILKERISIVEKVLDEKRLQFRETSEKEIAAYNQILGIVVESPSREKQFKRSSTGSIINFNTLSVSLSSTENKLPSPVSISPPPPMPRRISLIDIESLQQSQKQIKEVPNYPKVDIKKYQKIGVTAEASKELESLISIGEIIASTT